MFSRRGNRFKLAASRGPIGFRDAAHPRGFHRQAGFVRLPVRQRQRLRGIGDRLGPFRQPPQPPADLRFLFGRRRRVCHHADRATRPTAAAPPSAAVRASPPGPRRGLDLLDPPVEVGRQREQMLFLAVRASEDIAVTVDLRSETCAIRAILPCLNRWPASAEPQACAVGRQRSAQPSRSTDIEFVAVEFFCRRTGSRRIQTSGDPLQRGLKTIGDGVQIFRLAGRSQSWCPRHGNSSPDAGWNELASCRNVKRGV